MVSTWEMGKKTKLIEMSRWNWIGNHLCNLPDINIYSISIPTYLFDSIFAILASSPSIIWMESQIANDEYRRMRNEGEKRDKSARDFMHSTCWELCGEKAKKNNKTFIISNTPAHHDGMKETQVKTFYLRKVHEAKSFFNAWHLACKLLDSGW